MVLALQAIPYQLRSSTVGCGPVSAGLQATLYSRHLAMRILATTRVKRPGVPHISCSLAFISCCFVPSQQVLRVRDTEQNQSVIPALRCTMRQDDGRLPWAAGESRVGQARVPTSHHMGHGAAVSPDVPCLSERLPVIFLNGVRLAMDGRLA